MADRRAKYKQKGADFGNIERSRNSRLEHQYQRRKELRSQNFSRLRPLNETLKTPISEKSSVTISRNERLEKWKRQKEMKKKSEKRIVKPPFKVGIVHHRAFSPPFTNAALPSCSHRSANKSHSKFKVQQESPIKRITRVTERRLAAKAAAKAATEVEEKKSFAPPNYKFKPPAGLPNIPLFGRIRKGSMDASKFSLNFDIRTPKLETPNFISRQRKKSNSVSDSTPRRSKKFKSSEQTGKTPKSVETRLSKSLNKLASVTTSDSTNDSLSSQVFSDDAEVFQTPITESPSINVEMQKKELDFKEPVETNEKSSVNLNRGSLSKQLKSPLPDKDNLQSNLSATETVLEINSENDSLKLHEVDSPDQEVNSSKAADQVSEELEQLKPEKNTLPLDIFDKSFNDTLNPAIFSPYVVTRRGKKEARKEQKLRRGFNHSPEEIPTKETVMQNLNISIEEEKRTSQYFKCLLESETNRLGEKCDLWNDIIEKENPPEEAKAIVEQAIGQTRLLLRSKFKQFASLVQQCEKNTGDHLVACKDLQGFWDMMGVTVKNCEDRFKKVEELKAREWQEEEPQIVQIRKIPARKRLPSKKKSPVKKSPSKKVSGKSSLRDMILAGRQKKKEIEQNQKESFNEQVVEILGNVIKNSPAKVTSSNRRLSLITSRRFSEDVFSASKRVLKSQEEIDNDIGADIETSNVHVHLDESISYINSRQTPGKSILKRVKIERKSDPGNDPHLMKSTQKVNFNDNVQLNEMQVDSDSMSLTEALNRIDSTDLETEYPPEVSIRAEKKLDFDDTSFNESMPLTKDEATVSERTTRSSPRLPELNIIPPTPKLLTIKSSDLDNSIVEETKDKRTTRLSISNMETSDLQNSSKNKIKGKKIMQNSPRLPIKSKVYSDLSNSIVEEVTEDELDGTYSKTLRNRTIVGNLTPRSARKLNENSSSTKLGKSPIVKEDISFQLNEKNLSYSQVDQTGSLDLNLLFLNQSSSSSNGTPRSLKPILAKSPKHTNLKNQILTPTKQELIKNEVHDTEEHNESLSSLNGSRVLRRRTPKTKENNIEAGKQEALEIQKGKENESPMAKNTKNNTLLSHKLIKTPKTASKRAKIISDALEDTKVDSETYLSRKSILKMRKTPKNSPAKKVFENTEEESIYDKFQKMQLDDSLSNTLALSQINSPRQRRNNLKSANKLPIEESMDIENFTSNLETENLENSFGNKAILLKSNSKKKMSIENILTEKITNYKDSMKTILPKLKISEPGSPRCYPENEMPGEKENSPPEILKRKTLINQNINVSGSPKSVETPSRRKSIKKRMSCHVAECQDNFTSTPQLQRRNSRKLPKTPNSRRSMKIDLE